MQKKNSFGLILTCAVLFGTFRTPAMGKVVTYCPAHYTDIHTVYWDTQSSIPRDIVQTEWPTIEQNIDRSLESLIAGNTKISIKKTSDSAEKVLTDDPEAFYMKVVFSYAPKSAFTTPLHDDALVVWIESTRNEPTEGGKGFAPNTKISRSDLVSVTKGSQYLNGKFLSFASPFVYAPSKLLSQIGCDVLKYSSDKYCMNSNDPTNIKVAPQSAPPCVNEIKRQ